MSSPNEPIYLIVERGAGGNETAVIYYDLLPARLRRKIPKDPRGKPTEPAPIIYALRLDRLDKTHRNFWLEKSTVELYATYCWLRDEGTLPPANLADPPRTTEARVRKLGDYWAQPAVPWDSSAPPNPDYGPITSEGE